jgi:hypothetical protein
VVPCVNLDADFHRSSRSSWLAVILLFSTAVATRNRGFLRQTPVCLLLISCKNSRTANKGGTLVAE